MNRGEKLPQRIVITMPMVRDATAGDPVVQLGQMRREKLARSGRQAKKPVECECPKCGTRAVKGKNIPCAAMVCPACKVGMIIPEF